MKNNNIEEAMKLNIESWNRAGFAIPEPIKSWCRENGREDLIDCNKPNLSAETAFLPVPSRQELAEMLGVKLSGDLTHESLAPTEARVEPASEEDINAMLNLALEAMARDLGIPLPTNIANESMDIDKNGELPSMEEIFGIKRKE